MPRLDALHDRHAALDRLILEEQRRPRPDDDQLRRLKVEKLHIKEEIVRLASTLERVN